MNRTPVIPKLRTARRKANPNLILPHARRTIHGLWTAPSRVRFLPCPQTELRWTKPGPNTRGVDGDVQDGSAIDVT